LEIRWRFPHQSEDWFGMTVLFGMRSPQQFPICQTAIERYRAAQGRNDYTYLAHDLAARPAGKFPICQCAYEHPII
ncbi:MAG: hypothetical protein ACI4P4_07225, partial [Faecousia sp.]